MKKKNLPNTLFLESKVPYKKKKKKKEEKINHFTIHRQNTNCSLKYLKLNNIKFTKEKKKINHSTVYNKNTNCYLKYL